MFLVPGIIIAILTFPGVIIHEMAHQLFCRLTGTAVLEVCYFQFSNPAGYVVHEKPKTASSNILIGVGPFLLNTILGAAIAMPAALQVHQFESGGILEMFLMWLGVSIAMHSFPSFTDVKNIWSAVWDKETSMKVKVLATPLVVLLLGCALGSFVWLDLAYGVAVVMLIPNLAIAFLA